MGEPNYPRVTAADVKAAKDDRAHQVLTSLGVGAAAVTVHSALNAPFGFVGRFVVKGASGLTVTKSPGPFGAGRVSLPKTGIPLLFAPEPVGFVPAEFYGLHPNFVKNVLGFRVGSKPPFLNADESRVKTFEAREVADAIGARAVGVPNDSGFIRRAGFKVPPGPIGITRFEFEYLKSLPPDVSDAQALVPQLEARVDDLIGGKNNPNRARVDFSYYDRLSAIEKYGTGRGQYRHLTSAVGGSNDAVEYRDGTIVPVDSRGIPIRAALRG